MQRLELSERIFNLYGKPMLAEKFSYLKYAAGAVGTGSEFMGFDDEASLCRKAPPGFCLWLTAPEAAQNGTALRREYERLISQLPDMPAGQAGADGRHKYGIFEIGGFYSEIIGMPEPNSIREWFYIPEHALAAATSGKVFCDSRGEFSRIRNKLLNEMPADVRLKKTAAHLTYMAQCGQRDFISCLAHGERAAAQLSIAEFATHAVHVIFALNKRYAPRSKWKFRALKRLPLLSQTADKLEMLVSTPNSDDNLAPKKQAVEEICTEIARELCDRGLSSSKSEYLEAHALCLQDKISNRQLRGLYITEYGES